MGDGSALLFALFAVAAVGAAVWQWRARQRRLEGFKLVASRLGLRHSATDPFGILDEPFELLSRGDGRGVEHVLSGEWQGMPVRAFDYWYYDESTDSKGHTSRSYRRFSCAMTPIDAACSPVSVSPENVLTRLADVLTFRDIEFESEAFNRAWNVRSDDAAFAHALLDARMIEWLLAEGSSCAFEVVGDRVLVSSARLDPAAIPSLLATAKAFRERIPRVVFDLYPKDR
ncbi:MAG TPA: hypothetical protein VF044_05905 [Actinomycetota bacterium]